MILDNDQNGSVYQLILGNQTKDSFIKINTEYTSAKLAIAANIILKDGYILYIKFGNQCEVNLFVFW